MMKLRKGIIGLTNSGRKRILPEFLSHSLSLTCVHTHTHIHIHKHKHKQSERERKEETSIKNTVNIKDRRECVPEAPSPQNWIG